MTDSSDNPRHPRLVRNWLSLAGFILAIGSFFAFVLLFAIDLMAEHRNPYMGILTYVVAPGFLISGMALVAAGVILHRWQLHKALPGAPAPRITIDLARPQDKKLLAGFLVGTPIFLLLTAFGSHRTYQVSESVQFCGQACHTPMKPEFVTYQNSPHARVSCVECHVGPGAAWYFKSKLNGVRMLASTVANNFERPIKTPIKNLRPAQETCEHCHWPEKFVGNVERTYSHFLADETNTPFTVRMLLNVGGGETRSGRAGGIHWHMNLGNKVEYFASDEQRQVIPWVRFTDPQGVVTEYRTKDFQGEPKPLEIRRLDCMDCHNRPAHHFRSPNEAVDLAMSVGRIDPRLPWVKSNSVEVLTRNYATESEALQTIAAVLRAAYTDYSKIDSLVGEVQDIFRNNFFPEMKANWRVYPDNISHKNWAGCFRCHDGRHKTADGKRSIKASDCNSCHIILAQGSGPQLETLNPKGLPFFHIDAEYSDFACAECHTGGLVK
ncbi:MAG: cytochrome C [Verrucomicrobia bacterium]|nr:cytochrome C [Verrucomicrobiota bacterium]